MKEIKEVTFIRVTDYKIECPYCGELNGGYCGDIRGEKDTCEYCEEVFLVHSEADFDMY